MGSRIPEWECMPEEQQNRTWLVAPVLHMQLKAAFVPMMQG